MMVGVSIQLQGWFHGTNFGFIPKALAMTHAFLFRCLVFCCLFFWRFFVLQRFLGKWMMGILDILEVATGGKTEIEVGPVLSQNSKLSKFCFERFFCHVISDWNFLDPDLKKIPCSFWESCLVWYHWGPGRFSGEPAVFQDVETLAQASWSSESYTFTEMDSPWIYVPVGWTRMLH